MAIHFPTPSTTPRDVETCTAVFDLLARLYSGTPERPLCGEASLSPTDHPSAQIAAAHHAAQRIAALQVLDRLPFGVIALDVARRVRLVNTPAQRFIDDRQVLEGHSPLPGPGPYADAGNGARRPVRPDASEAQLALLMLEGLTIEEAARVRDVTTKTARAQWQTVLWKVAADHEGQVLSLLRTALALPVPDA